MASNVYNSLKKNAKKYVGNFNYRGAFAITRRADLLILDSICGNQQEAIAVFDYVQRVLAINEFAGEKGIPEDIKAMFPAEGVEIDQKLLSTIDSKLTRELGFSSHELDFLVNYEVDIFHRPEVAAPQSK